MPNWNSLAAFGREIEAMEKAIDAAEKRKITLAQAEAGKVIAYKLASRDLGSDRAFKNWTRQARIPLDLDVKTTASNGAILLPSKVSAGPWTVAEFGRHQGNASGFFGPGVNRRTGATSRTKAGAVRKVRARQSKRWNGTTLPKNTATDAVKVMDKELPKIADDRVRRIISKHFDVT